MKILNLVNQDKSDIKYKISKFPDGQQQITLTQVNEGFFEPTGNWCDLYTDISKINTLIPKKPVQIKTRLNNFQDLELIICTTKSLRELGVKEIHLYIPYFLGSRSDRKFEHGSCNYLKDVICPIVNSLNFHSVTCIDPHSDVLEACLDNFRKEDNIKLVELALNNGLFGRGKVLKEGGLQLDDSFVLVSPDAGASKKIYKLAEQIGYKGDIITCSKHRDKNGKLTKTDIGNNMTLDKDVIIIDDICDGGNTFINIAKEINIWWEFMNVEIKPKIYLIITHGIFSKGFNELRKYFDGIYTTNSYQDLNTIEYNKEHKELVKQLDVF